MFAIRRGFIGFKFFAICSVALVFVYFFWSAQGGVLLAVSRFVYCKVINRSCVFRLCNFYVGVKG